MVKDTGSKYFDTAYFVMRSDLAANITETDMINEAGRMIDSCMTERSVTQPKRTGSKLRSVAIVSAAVAILSVFVGIIAVLL